MVRVFKVLLLGLISLGAHQAAKADFSNTPKKQIEEFMESEMMLSLDEFVFENYPVVTVERVLELPVDNMFRDVIIKGKLFSYGVALKLYPENSDGGVFERGLVLDIPASKLENCLGELIYVRVKTGFYLNNFAKPPKDVRIDTFQGHRQRKERYPIFEVFSASDRFEPVWEDYQWHVLGFKWVTKTGKPTQPSCLYYSEKEED